MLQMLQTRASQIRDNELMQLHGLPITPWVCLNVVTKMYLHLNKWTYCRLILKNSSELAGLTTGSAYSSNELYSSAWFWFPLDSKMRKVYVLLNNLEFRNILPSPPKLVGTPARVRQQNLPALVRSELLVWSRFGCRASRALRAPMLVVLVRPHNQSKTKQEPAVSTNAHVIFAFCWHRS